MMKWHKLNNAVYTTSDAITCFNADDVTFLKREVHQTPDKRMRICAHADSTETLHEMMIAVSKESYVRPHKHLNKSESFHLIEGGLDVIVFDDMGNIMQIIPMGNYTSGKTFFYRLSKPAYHTILLKTELVIFHETTNGPFSQAETVYPSWAPCAQEKGAVDLFLFNLSNKIAIYEHKSKE